MTDLIMFYDTETTGVTDFKSAYDAPHQPNLIQLGYKVQDPHTRAVIYEVGHLVNTTGFQEWNGIEPGAEAVHHITEKDVRTYGHTPKHTMNHFLFWAELCGTFIAHNDQFDTRIMQCFAKRAGFSPDVFGTGRKFCTMQFTTNICKIPNAKGYGNKWPKLIEAYCNLVNKNGFPDAHNALADVNACSDIFWKLVDKGLLAINQEGKYGTPTS